MKFDPRAVTGIPTEPVGSLPRPQALLEAYADHDTGRIDDAALAAAQDRAVRDTLAQSEATGAPVVSDGEQLRSSFATYPVAPTAGTGADELSALFTDGHGRLLHRLTGGPFRYRAYAADTLARSVAHATRPVKQAVIAPSALALLYPPGEPVPGYPKERFERDLVDECERDIRSAFAAGAVRVSIDFSDGRLTAGHAGRNPWTGPDTLAHGIGLITAVLGRFTARERMNIGVHVCSPADRGTGVSDGVAYPELIREVLAVDAGYFLLQLADEPDADAICAAIGRHLRGDAGGVTPIAFVGVTDPHTPHVESASDVADTLVRAAEHVPATQLGSTDNCGFSPFSHDPKPLPGLPDLARGIAFRKIRSRVEGTRLAAEKLGIA